MEYTFSYSFSSDSSESDVEVLQQLSDWDEDEDDGDSQNSRTYKQRINYMAELNDSEFTYRFRLSKTVVDSLLKDIYPYLHVTSARNHGIAPLHQLLLTLRFYALGTIIENIAFFVGVSKSSACRTITDVTGAIEKLYPKYVKIEKHTQDKFYNISGFPRVHGIIGGTHLPIKVPDHATGEYTNMKGIFTLNVQAVCNADLEFLNTDVQSPGSVHEAAIFNRSTLRVECENGVLGNRLLIGDNAYPSKPYLMTPILIPSTPSEFAYNAALFEARNTIERCFERWKKRFPVLLSMMRRSLNKTQSVIIATTVLHNLCIINNLEDLEPEVAIPKHESLPVEVTPSEENNAVRQEIINNYFNR